MRKPKSKSKPEQTAEGDAQQRRNKYVLRESVKYITSETDKTPPTHDMDVFRAALTRRIKALLDRRAPMDQLVAGYERALANLSQCTELLKVSVSPATIGFTSFTIVAREGLEAIIILAALLAGLRGVEYSSTRKGIAGGAWMGLLVTGITFWLSRTVIHSLTRFGEKLEAVVSIFAVIILVIVTNWVFHRVYWVGWN